MTPPDGASVVIIHDIKTPLDWETLRYIAAVKGKALLDESTDSSPPRKSRSQPTLEENPVVRALRQQGLAVTRQNYLRAAGYPGEPDPESEATLPRELQKEPEDLTYGEKPQGSIRQRSYNARCD